MHVNALTGEYSSAEVTNITNAADNFALALWGETLYGNPQNHVGGRVLSLSETILDLAGDPWPSIWYSFQLLLKLVTPGEPTRSEAKLRAKVAKVVDNNIERLEEHERKNPEAPLKTIRNLSVMTGGGRTGPLSEFASEFTNLNLFGSFFFRFFKDRSILTSLRWSSQHGIEYHLVVDRAQQASRVPGEAHGRNQFCRHH